MRTPTVRGYQALAERMVAYQQLDASVPEAAMPPYMESFLAHLRLLIGVPFEYLVPDSRLLPIESIRFFYLDRSWTDRLVDGAIGVGKTGSREQAHHQAHSVNIQAQLDLTQRVVRVLQRGLPANQETPPAASVDSPAACNAANGDQDCPVTGFLLRSAAVSGWPSMDVRAFSVDLPTNEGNINDPNYAAWLKQANAAQLRTLRLERLSPSVLLALFEGVPSLVWCEEPHHGVQFGFFTQGSGYTIGRNEANGMPENTGLANDIPVPMRSGNLGVVAIRELRNTLYRAQGSDPNLVPQRSSADLAIELLRYPWRQRFEGAGGSAGSSGAFTGKFAVAQQVVSTTLHDTLKGLLT